MKKLSVIVIAVAAVAFSAFHANEKGEDYFSCYSDAMDGFSQSQTTLLNEIKTEDLATDRGLRKIKIQIAAARLRMKGVDFWTRYLQPVVYRQINGPLPVEWENEVFEKFEPPYRREGAGLTLAELHLEEETVRRDTLLRLIRASAEAAKIFKADSITSRIKTHHHFFLANRLFLLNLAAIYTTGFECPGTENIIPELNHMLQAVQGIYQCFNKSFSSTPLPEKYLALYERAISFAAAQPDDFAAFDHFTFIKDYVNPLFALNQQAIQSYSVVSRSYNDYTLNDGCNSIFDKNLCLAQNSKGIFSMVDDHAMLNEVERIGKLLFYDPILSGNNQRSCASCHAPTQYFTDTTVSTALGFDREKRISRNTPSLVNVVYNHLLMLDGKHISLQLQAKEVTTNALEMGGIHHDIVEKVLSCKEYKTAFKKFLKLTPEENEVTMSHIVSAITLYYSKFSAYHSPFDDAMNNVKQLDEKSKRGFNLFMSNAECATCHFVPFFNGMKPPYIGTEFEVLGTPEDTAFTRLSSDSGRYLVNPAKETLHAFRTTTVRNVQHTAPYMHNGVFKTLDEVLDFYDAGGGQGRNLDVPNQTLSPDSLSLSADEKEALISFLATLNENIIFEEPPAALPASTDARLNSRKVGGEY